jgi:CcmD family protein
MKNNKKWLVSAVVVLCSTLRASAADGMEEYFYQSGLIKVVIAVAAIVLTGMFVFLWSIDRRLSKMEKRTKKEQ